MKHWKKCIVLYTSTLVLYSIIYYPFTVSAGISLFVSKLCVIRVAQVLGGGADKLLRKNKKNKVASSSGLLHHDKDDNKRVVERNIWELTQLESVWLEIRGKWRK